MEHDYLVVVMRSVACIVIHQLSYPRERKREQANKKQTYKLRKLSFITIPSSHRTRFADIEVTPSMM